MVQPNTLSNVYIRPTLRGGFCSTVTECHHNSSLLAVLMACRCVFGCVSSHWLFPSPIIAWMTKEKFRVWLEVDVMWQAPHRLVSCNLVLFNAGRERVRERFLLILLFQKEEQYITKSSQLRNKFMGTKQDYLPNKLISYIFPIKFLSGCNATKYVRMTLYGKAMI